jgi:hypothetical protein
MASIQSVLTGFTCTVHASCRAYHLRTAGVPVGAPYRRIWHCLGTIRYLGRVRAHPPTAEWSELGGTCLARLVRLQDACLCLWMRRVLDSN